MDDFTTIWRTELSGAPMIGADRPDALRGGVCPLQRLPREAAHEAHGRPFLWPSTAERGDCSQRLWGSSGRRQDAPMRIVLLALVTNGKGAMPASRGDLTAKEIRKVVEYTRTGLGQ